MSWDTLIQLFRELPRVLPGHPAERNSGSRIRGMMERHWLNVRVRIAEARVRVLDHSSELERRHECHPLTDARRPLGRLVEFLDRLAGKRFFAVVISVTAALVSPARGQDDPQPDTAATSQFAPGPVEVVKSAPSEGHVYVPPPSARTEEGNVALAPSSNWNVTYDAGFQANANATAKGEMAIHAPTSRVQVWIMPTNEEIVVARQAKTLLQS